MLLRRIRHTKSQCAMRHRHGLAADMLVLVKSILGGLHHEYSLAVTPRARKWWP